MYANGLENRWYEWFLVFEALCHGDFLCFQCQIEPKSWVGDIGMAGVSERGQIGACIADVVEIGEALLQLGKFMATGEVGRAIGSENTGKQTKVVGDPISQRGIGTGDQVDGAAQLVLLNEESQYGLVVGQIC